MFLVLWGFEVKPGCETRLERVYRPGGDQDSLFWARSPPRGKSRVPRYWETARLPHCRLLPFAQIVRRISAGSI